MSVRRVRLDRRSMLQARTVFTGTLLVAAGPDCSARTISARFLSAPTCFEQARYTHWGCVLAFTAASSRSRHHLPCHACGFSRLPRVANFDQCFWRKAIRLACPSIYIVERQQVRIEDCRQLAGTQLW